MPERERAIPESDPKERPLRRVWRLRDLGGSVEVVRRQDVYENDEIEPFTPWLLDYSLRDPQSRHALLDLYRQIGGHLGASSRGLIERDFSKRARPDLESAFRRGDLVIVARRVQASSAAATTDEDKDQAGDAGATGSSAKKPSKTWIEIQLVDEDGDPVSGQKYKIELTDGSTREGTLDASGSFRFSGIDPGTCTVWFPDIDAGEWDRA